MDRYAMERYFMDKYHSRSDSERRKPVCINAPLLSLRLTPTHTLSPQQSIPSTILTKQTLQQVKNIYLPGEIVYIPTDWYSHENQPKDCQKLWIWEYKWDPNYINKLPMGKESYGNWLYLLKDGAGEKAKNVCWASEDKIQEWTPPKVEESLIDLDPGYEVKKKKGQEEERGLWEVD